MELEEAIKGLKDIIKGDKDCMESIASQVNNTENDEDYMHFKKEIESIETIVNAYKKEKARADKLEKEYSKMLTKLDEYKEESIPRELVEEKIEEINQEKEHYIDLLDDYNAQICDCITEELQEILKESK